MKKYLITVLSAACLLSACDTGAEQNENQTQPDKAAARAEVRSAKGKGKKVKFDWCAEFEWYGDGICDDFCAKPDPDCAPAQNECFVGGCSGQVCSDQEGVISTCEFRPEYACFQTATCERQADGECGWTKTEELNTCLEQAATPPAPTFCADGKVAAGKPSFVPSADGRECEIPDLHCLTTDGSSCPQFSPPHPDFCKNGTIVSGEPRFIASADGMECEIPSLHCVTNDSSFCPQFSPLPPDFCLGGTIVSGTPRFIPSADGMECQMPSVHCLTSDLLSCPQL